MRLEQGVQEMERGGKVLWIIPYQKRAKQFIDAAVDTCTVSDIEIEETYCRIRHRSGGFIQFMSQERANLFAVGVDWTMTNNSTE